MDTFQIKSINIILGLSFHFRMNHNQKVIHLGRNKSPEQFKRPVLQSHNRERSPKGGRQEGKHPNLFVSTHPGFYSHGPKKSEDLEISFSKENSMLYATCENFNGPQRKQNAFADQNQRNKGHLSINSSIVGGEKEAEIRRSQMLEARIQELHHEKQSCLLRARQQGMRLTSQNNFLRQKLMEVQNINAVLMRKMMAVQSRPMQVPIGTRPGPSGYYHEQKVQENVTQVPQSEDNISINFHIDRNNESDTLKFSRENQYYAEIQKQNEKLKRDLAQRDLDNERLKELAYQLDKKIRNLEDLLSKETQKSSGLAKTLAASLQQTQFYVQRSMEKSQQMMRLEDTHKSQISALEVKLKQIPSECQKCKEFIKALVKLNQKVYTGVNQNI